MCTLQTRRPALAVPLIPGHVLLFGGHTGIRTRTARRDKPALLPFNHTTVHILYINHSYIISLGIEIAGGRPGTKPGTKPFSSNRSHRTGSHRTGSHRTGSHRTDASFTKMRWQVVNILIYVITLFRVLRYLSLYGMSGGMKADG